MLRSLTVAALLAVPIALTAQAQPSTGEPWQLVQPPQSSLVYARDGSLIGEIGREWRTSVSIRTLPKYVGQAFVAVEDHRFYQHNGVDVVGVLGALKDAALGDARGASTITQQLVGNMHPDVIDRRDKSLGRKVREQEAAREMERHYTKEQILEAYLNQINFGHGWYGIDAAARHYFGKPAAQLTLPEAASLASLPKSPVGYDPSRFPDRNRERRNTVLALMAGQGYITKQQADIASMSPVTTVAAGGLSATAPYFVDVVRQQAERAGVPVGNGGYRI
ncbi:MAG: penicillin-binding protein, partial [Gemmatimonadaceae bacterium]|nr:penicillin-binding protein [Gemmatimonadaceae bacterium]